MKTIFGVLIVLFIITGAALTVLALWGVQPISWGMVWRSGATVMIVGVMCLLLWFVKILFFSSTFMGKKNKGL